MSELVKILEQEIAQLEADRALMDTVWKDCAEITQPHKEITTQSTHPGKVEIETTLEITAQQSNLTLASGQMSHITPMGERWFALAPPPELANDSAAIRYYAQVTETIHAALANSNFYNVSHEQFLDLGTFGIAGMMIRAGRNNKGLHFEPFAAGSFSVAEDSYGVIDRVARRYECTAHQIAQMFPDGALPEDVSKAIEKSDFKKFPLVHYIRPNVNHDEKSPFSFAFDSFYIFYGEKKQILKKAGYREMPCPVSRWIKWGNTAYGISPTFFALPTARQANYLESLGDLLGELAAYPRNLVPSSLKGEIDYRPNGVTIFDSSMGAAEMPRTWMHEGRYDVLQDRLNHKIKQIRDCFHVSLFEMVHQLDKQATAYEVQELVKEKATLFHPIFVRSVTERLIPTIMRCYAILAEQPYALPTPPASVIGAGSGAFIPDPEVTFVSTLALALTRNQYSNLPAVLGILEQAAKFDPSVADSFNAPALFPMLARAQNLPIELIRTEEEIAAREQAQQQAAAMAQAEQAAASVQKLGGAQGIQELGGMMQQ